MTEKLGQKNQAEQEPKKPKDPLEISRETIKERLDEAYRRRGLHISMETDKLRERRRH